MGSRRMYRSRLQIMADILLAAEKSPVKTHIMFQSYLNIHTLNRYLDELVEAGLLELKSSSYYVTQKGRRFLDRLGEYSKHRRKLEERLKHVSSKKAVLESMLSNCAK